MEKEDENKKKEGVNPHQEQINNIVFSREIGWQEIIYDLINTEQLDPWNIDLIALTNKFLEKIQELEENYFVSSKVLLAAALLLRIKSEILLNKYIKSIDEILFGKKEKKQSILERIELDEEIPELIPRSPIPRFRKVTLKELIESLDKAVVTENRRIKKEIWNKNALREAAISLPKRKYLLRDKIKEIYEKIYGKLKDEEIEKILFSEFFRDKEEKIIALTSLLHLEHQNKLWLEQKEHFGDIHIWHKKTFFKKNPHYFDDLIDNSEIVEEEGDEEDVVNEEVEEKKN